VSTTRRSRFSLGGPRSSAKDRAAPRHPSHDGRLRWRGLSVFWALFLCAAPGTSDAAPPESAPSSRRPLEPEERLPRPRSLTGGFQTPSDEPSDEPLHIEWRGEGCALGVQPALALRLRTLATPTDPLVSLEVWGGKDAYAEGDAVQFHLRSPRRGYATLFWVGPNDDVFIVFNDTKVAAARDVRIDAGAIIVAPTGPEHWVGVLSLESAPFPCTTSRQGPNRWLGALSQRAHAVGHWEITTTPTGRRP